MAAQIGGSHRVAPATGPVPLIVTGRDRLIPLTFRALAQLVACGDGVGRLLRRPSIEVLYAAWARTNLPGRAPSWHDFRHPFSSRALAAGLDLEELRVTLGHRDIATTQRSVHLYGNR